MTLLKLFKYRAADPVQYRDDYILSADDARRIAKALAIAQTVEEQFRDRNLHPWAKYTIERADELLGGKAVAPQPPSEIVLPPLPGKQILGSVWPVDGYSETQMLAYARAATLADRERR